MIFVLFDTLLYFRPGNAGVHRSSLPSGDTLLHLCVCVEGCVCVQTNFLTSMQLLPLISYLHSCDPPIIHGNITCDTIFIQHNGLIKIGSGIFSPALSDFFYFSFEKFTFWSNFWLRHIFSLKELWEKVYANISIQLKTHVSLLKVNQCLWNTYAHKNEGNEIMKSV